MTNPARTPPEATFGGRLRSWRMVRGLSQLDLAARAGVSQRHLSFLETGRSRPSREMVLKLGDALDVPLRAQNLLLDAAGFHAAYTSLPIEALPGIGAMVDSVLAAHEPNPAVAIDRLWDIVAANSSARGLLDRGSDDGRSAARPNLIALVADAAGAGACTDAWEGVAVTVARVLERDVANAPFDPALASLLAVARSASRAGAAQEREPSGPVGTIEVPIGERWRRVFPTITSVVAANDVTAGELRIVTLWPAEGTGVTPRRTDIDDAHASSARGGEES